LAQVFSIKSFSVSSCAPVAACQALAQCGKRQMSRNRDRWDATGFAAELMAAKGEEKWDVMKRLLAKVAEHNYKIHREWRIPRTIPVSYDDCRRFRTKGRKSVEFSISSMTTAEACQHFASIRGNVVCALNFANGEAPGGGYKHGATAQEEDLCRQMPTLYSTLYAAQKEGLYPFGPATCSRADRPEKYADVLYTTGLVIAREGQEEGYAVLPPERQVQVSLVTAAAPNIRFKKEVNEPELLYKCIQSIFVAPVMVQPEVTTLILGAWGCGAFGGDPLQIADLFVQALVRDSLGQPYKEIHFAIPCLTTKDVNAEAFRTVFAKYELPFTDMDTTV